jgi:hypothetical protein
VREVGGEGGGPVELVAGEVDEGGVSQDVCRCWAGGLGGLRTRRR